MICEKEIELLVHLISSSRVEKMKIEDKKRLTVSIIPTLWSFHNLINLRIWANNVFFLFHFWL